MGNDQGGGKKKKNPGDELFDASFEMKQQAKTLEREAAKVQQQEQKERQKILSVSSVLTISQILTCEFCWYRS